MTDRKYDAIVFDLDGTLLNTLEDLKDSVNYGLRKFGMPERSLEEIRCFVGNGVQKLIERAVPKGTSQGEYEQVFMAFKKYYSIHCNDKTDLYPGIRELLTELKKSGYCMAIVSNKLQTGVETLKELYFKDYITVAIGGKEGIPQKPAPDMVIEAMEQLGITKEKVVYVGDSEVDIATAANTGIDCIVATWGFRSMQELLDAGGEIFADDPMDILKII